MFKQKTNVRPESNKNAELTTTTTSGTMRITGAASSKTGINAGDYASIVEDDDKDSPFFGIYLVKGYGPTKDPAGKVTEPAFGAKLAAAKGKNAGSLGFSSESAYNCLKGEEGGDKIVYTIEDGITHADFTTPLFKLTFNRKEAKSVKKAKESVAQ